MTPASCDTPGPAAGVEIIDLHPRPADVRAEVLAGLSRPQARLPSKLFYDAAGSALFERITELPEYYQTRAEIEILRGCADELSRLLGENLALIEYGSGSSTKTRLLLEALDITTYVPIDISRSALLEAARGLAKRFPRLRLLPIVADYAKMTSFPDTGCRERVGFFPGGTIGNFTPRQARRALRGIARTLGSGGRLIIGVDLKKDPAILHAAYNDAAGVTAQFNANLLVRLNRELEADFDTAAWRHYAPYVPGRGRIEMHLVSAVDQRARVAGAVFEFPCGRSIRTEISCKYTPAEFQRLAEEAGFACERLWVDAARLFSVHLLRAGG